MNTPKPLVDIDHLRTWIGTRQQRADYVCPSGAARIAALLDQEAKEYVPGQSLCAAWYVMLFTATEPQSQLGPDGHPRKGAFLPPVPLPRRMFAGRRIQFHGDLVVGRRIVRESTIADVQLKRGASGEMCFVTVRHEFLDGEHAVLVEEQDIVYRGPAAPSAPGAARRPAAELPAATAHTELVFDPTMLFRYSAITFNAHRIHYDAEYAREAEHYPGLVVNGGLTTLFLWNYAMRQAGGARIRVSRSRNLRPLFVNQRVGLNLTLDPQTGCGHAWAANELGETAILIELEMERQ